MICGPGLGIACPVSQSHMRFCALWDRAAVATVPPSEDKGWKQQMHARTEASEHQAAPWPDDIFAILQRHDVRQVPYVPDAGHSQLIKRVLASSTMRGIPLTTEEEGVALLAGGWAG